MNTTSLKTALLVLAASLFAANTYAETLISAPHTLPKFAFQLQDKEGTNSASWTDGVQVRDTTDVDRVYRLFCTDLYTSTSSAFGAEGQVYDKFSLTDSPFHTAAQAGQLQSLFDHVYLKAFNEDYTSKNDLYSTIFQLAVWEIANDTAENLSLRDGDIYITKALVIEQGPNGENRNHWDNTVLSEALNTLDSWFNAIANDSWDSIGYSKDDVNLTVYLAEGGTDKSQTFIGVDPNPPTGAGSAPTPEPATMLIFGLGMAGLGFARRSRKG